MSCALTCPVTRRSCFPNLTIWSLTVIETRMYSTPAYSAAWHSRTRYREMYEYPISTVPVVVEAHPSAACLALPRGNGGRVDK